MKKIGFFIQPTMEWIGGINYYRNLFLAIHEVEGPDIEVIVFLSKNIDKNFSDMLFPEGYSVKIVFTSMLQKFTPYWFLWKLTRKVFGSDFVALPLCMHHGIDVVSHSNFANMPVVRTISWIPDFQHIHLPEMFRQKEIKSRNKEFLRLINGSDRIIVSSVDAAQDLLRLHPKAKNKIFILPFAISAPDFYLTLDGFSWQSIATRHQIKEQYFYVPNQFWKHKNHKILVDATVALKAKGIKIQIVLSGVAQDYRNPSYSEELKKYIVDSNCSDSFRILNVIPYHDVFTLIKFSLAVINPSRFEGWSSTVEECKSVGKQMVLSDIAVHREQMPGALFFKDNDQSTLVDCLEECLINLFVDDDINLISALEINKVKIRDFGKEYLKLVNLV